MTTLTMIVMVMMKSKFDARGTMPETTRELGATLVST